MHTATRLRKWPALILLSFAVVISPAFSQPLSPPQAAYLKLQQQKAQDEFVARVSIATSAPGPMVRRALPDRARITDPVVRLIAALERDLRRTLSDEQKAAIQAAEADYQSAIRSARAIAPTK